MNSLSTRSLKFRDFLNLNNVSTPKKFNVRKTESLSECNKKLYFSQIEIKSRRKKNLSVYDLKYKEFFDQS